MTVIYKPKGNAAEYAQLALNIYKGCTHGCVYCYGPAIMRKKKEYYFADADPKPEVLERTFKDMLKLKNTECPTIQISFIGDPYQPAEERLMLTRKILIAMVTNELPFTILTKGGHLAARDFDILRDYPYCSFGQTISSWDEQDRMKWEPYASPLLQRLDNIVKAHYMGIKTWVSLEPVIDTEQALRVIRMMYGMVDHWKIGKLNHFPETEKLVDWKHWRDQELIPLLEEVGADYYLKESLTEL